MKLISVIIIVYNAEKYLRECIESVISQQGVNIEIIIVDDGSTDSSLSICEQYSKKDSRIKLIHKKNGGASSARNAGLDEASGEYIYFVDSDDVVAEGALQTLYEKIEESKADFVMGNYQRIDEQSNPGEISRFPEYARDGIVTEEQFYNITELTHEHTVTVVWSKLYKRQLWNDLRFPEGRGFEDDYVLPLITAQCDKIYCIDKVIMKYRINSSSVMHSGYSMKSFVRSETVASKIEYLLDKGFFACALYEFGDETRNLMSMKEQGLAKDKEIAKNIRHYYRVYCKLAKKLYPYVNTKNKLRLRIFMINFDLYAFFRKLTVKA